MQRAVFAYLAEEASSACSECACHTCECMDSNFEFLDANEDFEKYFDAREDHEIYYDAREYPEPYYPANAFMFYEGQMTPAVPHMKSHAPFKTARYTRHAWAPIHERETCHVQIVKRYKAKQGWGRKKYKPPAAVPKQPTKPSGTRVTRIPAVHSVLLLLLLWFFHIPGSEVVAVTTMAQLASYLQVPADPTTDWARMARLPPVYIQPPQAFRRVHACRHAPHAPPHDHTGTGGDDVADLPVHARPPDQHGSAHRAQHQYTPSDAHYSIDEYDPSAGIDGSTRGPMVAHSAISMFLPDGETTTPAAERYDQCPDTKIMFGKHPEVPEHDRKQFKDMCLNLYGTAFARDMKDITGYTGDMGPLKIDVISDKLVFSRPRKLSHFDKEIADQKCTEMRDAGIIEPAPKAKYASSPTVAAKKAPDGTQGTVLITVKSTK